MPAFNSVGSYLTKGSLTTLQYYPIYGNCCSSIKSVARILPLRKTFPFSNCPREELEQKSIYITTGCTPVCYCYFSMQTFISIPAFHSSLFIIFPLPMKLQGISTLSLQLGKTKCWQRIRLVCVRGNSPTLGYALSKLCRNICMLLYCKVCRSTPKKTSQLPCKSDGFLLKSNC